jgi:rRNA maturation RNase YbeY
VPVSFHTEKISFNLKQKLKHKQWINQWIVSQGTVCGELSFIFTSNKQLRLINQKYLNHIYNTDVITFSYREGDIIAGDIFISVEQVRINAISYVTDQEDELRRVMIHGVNHLLGFDDGNDEERKRMRQMENEALHLWLKMV